VFARHFFLPLHRWSRTSPQVKINEDAGRHDNAASRSLVHIVKTMQGAWLNRSARALAAMRLFGTGASAVRSAAELGRSAYS